MMHVPITHLNLIIVHGQFFSSIFFYPDFWDYFEADVRHHTILSISAPI